MLCVCVTMCVNMTLETARDGDAGRYIYCVGGRSAVRDA